MRPLVSWSLCLVLAPLISPARCGRVAIPSQSQVRPHFSQHARRILKAPHQTHILGRTALSGNQQSLKSADWVQARREPAAFGNAGAREYHRLGGTRAVASPIELMPSDAQGEFAGVRGVVVFSRAGCPYCVKVKQLLSSSGIPFEVVDVVVEPDRRAEAIERSGGSTTVPQVFMGLEALGGFENVSLLSTSGELKERLRRFIASGSSDVIVPTPASAFAAADPLPPGAMALLGKTGRAIAARLESGQLRPGKRPSLLQFLKYAMNRKPLPYDDSIICLNDVGMTVEEELPEVSVEQLLAALRTQMLLLTDRFVDPEGNVEYVRLRASNSWFEFLALAAQLGGARAEAIQQSLENFDENEKKAFLINLYNVMTFHGVVQFGKRAGTWFIYAFFVTNVVSYSVGTARLSLDEVENGLLRLKPGYFQDPAQAACLNLRVKTVDPRIHMALNCGSKGCPAIAVYSAATLDAELDDAVAAFMASDANMLLEPDANPPRVGFSMIFQWYLEDFLGASPPKLNEEDRAIAIGLLRWALPYTSGARRSAVEASLSRFEADASCKLTWIPYDWSTNGEDVELDWRVYVPGLF